MEPPVSPGSADEPHAEGAAEQMQEAVERLRDQASVLRGLVTTLPDQPDRLDVH